ncbi:MAG: DNA repair protein RadA [Chloroflexi bacterium]|nr:DNA repair protein RadA [Chloroflexota bacterium]
MAKGRAKSIFVCQQCGYESPSYLGRCPMCNQWNSLVETVEGPASPTRPAGPRSQPQPLPGIPADDFRRLVVPLQEFNRVLGGGIVPGSVVLIGGDPGIGKSTLLLQISALLVGGGRRVLYVSGEESVQQIKMRAERLGIREGDLYLLAETGVEYIEEQIERLRPAAVIVDSIQTMSLESMTSAAGSVSQVRESAASLLRVAKSTNVPVFLVGHVTKEGAIAGPRVLEHIVDTVLYLEGERFHSYRLLRGVKNRFGSTNEVGLFEMTDEGLTEVGNPSAAFLSGRAADTSGSSVAVTMEGTRPILVEVQALTSTTSFGLPRRTANGIEYNRLLMLVAVLTKRVGLALANQDIYVNVVGGLKVSEPAIDLSVVTAIASSFRNQEVDPEVVVIGEIGLSGELRSVGQLERRLAEAAKLGFLRAIHPRSSRRPHLPERLEAIGVTSTDEALEMALKR